MNEKISPCNQARPDVSEVRPLIRHALRRATFPVGEGFLPAGDFLFQSVLNL